MQSAQLRYKCSPSGQLAPVAQLDRVLDYESRGREFESSPARHALVQQTFASFAIVESFAVSDAICL